MRAVLSVLVAALCLSSVDATSIWLDVSRNGLVAEQVSLEVPPGFGAARYVTVHRPLAVLFDGEYTLEELSEGYALTLRGTGVLNFTMLHDDMVSGGSVRSIRAAFTPGQDGELELAMTLPEGAVLASEPSAIPRPDKMSTDGRRTTLSWRFVDAAEVSVFYRQPGIAWPLVLGLGALVIVAGIGAYTLASRRSRKDLSLLLSPEESKLLAAIQGPQKQKKLAQSLGFSKSKMSKLVRRLEEKGLIASEPHFKTNILRRR